MEQTATHTSMQKPSAAAASVCPECGKTAPVGTHRSYWVWSALVLTRWGTTLHTCCANCARKHRHKAIMSCLALGWWGIPFGLFVTPMQIYRNTTRSEP